MLTTFSSIDCGGGVAIAFFEPGHQTVCVLFGCFSVEIVDE